MSAPIRPNIHNLTKYVGGRPISEVKRELGLDRVVKLASNENPLGPSPKAVAAVREAAARLNEYPDGAAFELKNSLSKRFSLEGTQIVLGNGSDELIHLLGLVFLNSEEDEVIAGDPSFVRYDAAAVLAASRLIKVPLDHDFKHDLNAMAAKATERTRLIFVANPNNPTGTVVLRQEFEGFLNDLPSQAMVVLDEAYYEFAAHLPHFPNSLDYVREGRNVVGLRTFSKAYGLAGIRIGYGFATPEVADALERTREPFNVNSLAQAGAVAALEDAEHIQRTLDNNREGMERIIGALRAQGIDCRESYGNFVFIDLGRPAKPIFEALLREGVIVRAGDIFGTPNCIRITIGTEEEVTLLLRAFDKVLAASAAV